VNSATFEQPFKAELLHAGNHPTLNVHIYAFMGKYAFPIILRGTLFISSTIPHRLVLATERRPALCEVGNNSCM
jgi:hypothetical protein